MIGGSVNGDLDGLLARLREFREINVMPLAEDIAGALVEGNREGLLAGLDADGNPMAPLAESTIRRGRGGDGEPLVPRDAASPLIAGFRAEVVADADGAKITAGWDSVPEVKYFAEGTRHMPRRNPIGVRPATMAKIRDLVGDFARKLIDRR